MSVIAELAEIKREHKKIFGRILFATDFSEVSERAMAFAVGLAAKYGSELFVVHATEPEPREPIPLDPLPRELDKARAVAEREMRHLLKSAKLKDVVYHSVVQRGEVWHVLLSVIEREHIDLLVMGTHGRRGLSKLALGSVAEEVAHRAPCPVLTVGPNVPAARAGEAEFRNILFATDFAAASARALPYVIDLAEDYASQLVMLHMVEPMPVADIAPAAYGPPVYAAQELAKWQGGRRRESEARLKDLIPATAKLAYPPIFEVGMDFLPEGILETAKQHKSELIVMGASRSDTPRLAAHFPWALTSEVLRKARCPVLTVRN
jgi:nucleotide-binding universal stress UspA family protein